MAQIFNAFIADGGLTDTEKPVSAANRESWLAAHGGRYPVCVWEADGSAVGWSSLSPFSPRPDDARLAEIGVYVAKEWQGRGIGRTLVTHLLDEIDKDIETVFAIIFARNSGSRRLFEQCGFVKMAHLREPAMLRDRWEDVLWYARRLGGRV
jgi:phosphinothricin acetyltransferase